MSQIRLYIQGKQHVLSDLYQRVEPIFEDHGFPLALVEVDEKKQLFEFSIYGDLIEKNFILAQIAAHSTINPANINVEILPDIDWVKYSLSELKPIRVGGFFIHGSHDRDKITANDMAIEMEAGLAFGTGHHGTTFNCLELLSEFLSNHQPQNILDLGTGSGILSIALAKRGLKNILASDLDPIAISVANDNIELNHVTENITTCVANGFSHDLIKQRSPFDLIIANILAAPLVDMASEMTTHLQNNGTLILSGLLDNQVEWILSTYQTYGFQLEKNRCKDQWAALQLTRIK